ncbi:hypothetical protein N7453_008470 [Penicillium expansum]|nr:hypothetical protein N7453_008470 [Penicillium expansum]
MLAVSTQSTPATMNKPEHYDAPPMYSPSSEFNSFLDEKADNPIILLPDKTSLGLPLHLLSAEACKCHLDPEPAHQDSKFTQVVCDEAKLSRQQWTTVVGKGLGTMAVGGLMVGILGAIPAIFVARLTRNRQEQRNLISSMAGARGEHLARHISQWNETVFRPRGVLIRVDLPDEYLNDMEDMDIRTSGRSARSAKKSRDKAALKARIVIIPLDGSMPTGNSSN